MRRFGKKGQGTLEYVILLSAVVAALLVAGTQIRDKMNTGLSNAGTKMQENLETVFPSAAAPIVEEGN